MRAHERRHEERQRRAEEGPRAAEGRRDDRVVGARAQGDLLHGDREVDRSAQEGEARGRDLLGLVRRATAATSATAGDVRLQRRPRRVVGVPAHGRSRPAAGGLPVRRDAADASRAARRERVVVAVVHRPRLRRPGRHRLEPRDRAGEEGRRGRRRRRRSPTTRPIPKEYFGYKRDLESMCEFMGRWLSEHGRWGSPVFIAGESYGGYRVGRLARMLQETAGIGLNGAILISPALEITPLNPTDYDVLGWIDRVPTMAAAAFHHGRSRAFRKGSSLDKVFRDSEEFATGDYTAFLTRGASMPAKERDADPHAARRHRRPAGRPRRARRGSHRDPDLRRGSSCATSGRSSGSTTRRSPRPTRSRIATSSRGPIRRSRASAPPTRWP